VSKKGAPKGNQFWRERAKHGRDKLFKTPELLWEAACEYFTWVEQNPLYELKAFNYQGEIVNAELPKMRAMTLSGLCFYLGCNEAYFRNFKNQKREDAKDFSSIIEQIETIIYNQKFQGAAADLLNANIIARDLGLRDNTDLTSKGDKINNSPLLFLSADRLTDEQIQQYLQKDAGNNDESI
jgi:hypothetical protein